MMISSSQSKEEYLVVYKLIGHREDQAVILRVPSLLLVPDALCFWWAEHGEPGFDIDRVHISISKVRG